MQAAIEFDDVSKTYGRVGRVRPALDAVSFRVEPGSFVLLTGSSGAGKTTLIKLLLAMEQPEQGAIRVAGRDVHKLTRSSIPYLRRNLGVVFQDFRLLPNATPLDNVRLALQVLGLAPGEIKTRTTLALQRVGLSTLRRKPVRQLSGGEQQRVALARAMASRPPILLADEPTGNLDPELSRLIIGELDALSRQGTTVLLATHDPLIRTLVHPDHILRLESGKLVTGGTATPYKTTISHASQTSGSTMEAVA
ncbi:MAG: ATP-binding cassette domain-containing protein [Nannocystaceae bacterium]